SQGEVATKRTRTSRVRLLLILPVGAVMWVPFFNRIEPALFGIPFFYWYQLAWILLCAVVVGIVYLAEH
ncbi:DUF3311 domain-containing protein, partial [Acidisphaera rubrifaciens]|uniref:DUF3311 domain-containing protein n=1 Tax=Acidisphaera rubrifaciens TaxID=50715 RepID=UPI00069C2BA5